MPSEGDNPRLATPLLWSNVSGESIDDYRGLWEKSGFDAQKDLLVVFDGKRWEARGWGLSEAKIASALSSSRPTAARSRNGLAVDPDVADEFQRFREEFSR